MKKTNITIFIFLLIIFSTLETFSQEVKPTEELWWSGNVQLKNGMVLSIDIIFFIEHLKQYSEPPRRFSDFDSLKEWFDPNARETFEAQVRRGLFIRMSDDRVYAALCKLPS